MFGILRSITSWAVNQPAEEVKILRTKNIIYRTQLHDGRRSQTRCGGPGGGAPPGGSVSVPGRHNIIMYGMDSGLAVAGLTTFSFAAIVLCSATTRFNTIAHDSIGIFTILPVQDSAELKSCGT